MKLAFLLLTTTIALQAVSQAQELFQCPKLTGSYGPCVATVDGELEAGPDLIKIQEGRLNGYPHFLLSTEKKNQETKELSLLVDEVAHPAIVLQGATMGYVAMMTNVCQDQVLHSSKTIKNRLTDTFWSPLSKTTISLSGESLKIVEVQALNNFKTIQLCPRQK